MYWARHPLAPIRLTNAAAQLPYGSGETQGEGMPLHLTCYMKFDELLVHNRKHVLVSAFLLLVLLSLFTMFDNVAFFEEDIL